MVAAKLDDETFIAEFPVLGAAGIAKKYGVSVRNAQNRRRRLEGRFQIQLNKYEPVKSSATPERFPERVFLELQNGIVFVASDFHYWPGTSSATHRAIVKLAKELNPSIFIANGDVMDCATVSRHPPIGWEGRPSISQEIEVCQDRLHEIASALPPHARRIWTLGNHDARFETYIATQAPELAKVRGIHLHDHFPDWERCYSTWVNDDAGGVVIKHRFKGGIHAPRNNTLYAGRSIVTGHLHSAKVSPHDDYNGTRYGVDTGCVADPYHRAFGYAEDNPRDWRSGFCILTFWRGKLLQPELAMKLDDQRVQFRGQVIEL